jgi:muramoyltetrapeptide carboxypeptidase
MNTPHLSSQTPIYPPFLQDQDEVWILAPSGKIAASTVEQAACFIENQWNLKVKVGAFVGKNHYRFAATDEQRLHDLQAAFDDPTVRAIFCARGGYGVSRILERLDFSGLLRFPKWLIGFSDITFLHARLSTLGLVSCHALMPSQFAWQDAAIERPLAALRRALGGSIEPIEGCVSPHQSAGEAVGLTVGGNLCVLQHTLGTSYEPQWQDKILFVEDVGESLYRIDRMLVQLKSAGIFDQIAGLVVGDFTGSTETQDDFGQSLEELFAHHWQAYQQQKPLAFGFPIGHTARNFPIWHNALAQLHVTEESVRMGFGGISRS